MAETVGAAMDSGKHVDKSSSIRNFFSESNNFSKEPAMPTSKLPCVYYAENHKVSSFTRFQNMGVNVGISPGISDFVFIAWQVTVKDERVL